MAPGLFFEVVFLLLNGSAHLWDERSNFRGECQIWEDLPAAAKAYVPGKKKVFKL